MNNVIVVIALLMSFGANGQTDDYRLYSLVSENHITVLFSDIYIPKCRLIIDGTELSEFNLKKMQSLNSNYLVSRDGIIVTVDRVNENYFHDTMEFLYKGDTIKFEIQLFASDELTVVRDLKQLRENLRLESATLTEEDIRVFQIESNLNGRMIFMNGELILLRIGQVYPYLD
ncbi:MAG: hypothetical protein QNK23_14310 [Crocinitomicaceae bacterium]|nr:hypothetical protein [Crocinitomicaceae bacterium]